MDHNPKVGFGGCNGGWRWMEAVQTIPCSKNLVIILEFRSHINAAGDFRF